jgi:small-conductance mechanosensitive channel
MAGTVCAASEQGEAALSEPAPVQAAPVAPFHKPIFSIYAKLGPFTPAERAERVERMIRQLKEDMGFSPGRMKLVPDGATLDIVYNATVVMSVADGDAEYFQKSKNEVAEYYRENIARAIEQHRQDTVLMSILTRTGLVLLVFGLFFFIVRYVNRLHKHARRKIVALRGTFIKGVRIKSYVVMDEHRCLVFLLFFIKIIKYVVLFTILYFLLPLLFSIFPETRGLANKLLDYVWAPFSTIIFSVVAYLPNAFAIIVIVTIFRYLAKGIRYFAGEIEKEKLVIKGFYPDWATPTCNLIRTLLYVFMFIVIFPHLPNSESKIFQGVSVFIGVLISLGSTALIGNLISGMVITYMRPFRTGDFIKIGDVLGTVVEKTHLAIRIMTPKNEEITIPNSNIMSAHTTNYSYTARENSLILYATVTFGYDTPWRQVHELLLSAASRTRHVLATPAPFILQRALDNFFAEYQVNVYVAEEKLMPRIYSELYENIQDAFKEAGLDMTTPAYQNLRYDNQIQITQKTYRGNAD